MNILQNKMKRREFVRNAFGTGLGAAIISQIPGARLLGATNAKRFIMIFYPNGCVRDKWHTYPTGGITPSTLTSGPLEPLSPFTDRLTLLKNLTYAGHGGSSVIRKHAAASSLGVKTDLQVSIRP